jgi:small subunit ribosomal protein S20
LPSEKSARVSEAKRVRNRAVRSKSRTVIAKARAILTETPGIESANEALSVAYSNLDKTAQRGIIHRKNAARRKSRLARLANAVS